MRKRSDFLVEVATKLPLVIGLVLIWRGIWYVADWIDVAYFDGNHLVTAIGGILVGFILLYLPDRDLKEIDRL